LDVNSQGSPKPPSIFQPLLEAEKFSLWVMMKDVAQYLRQKTLLVK
jgi:hypothetical protein